MLNVMPTRLKLTRYAALVVVAASLPWRCLACSQMPGYHIQWGGPDTKLPANAEFRLWHGFSGIVQMELTDGNNPPRRVPAMVITGAVPAVMLPGNLLPIYGGHRFYTVLRPFQPLAPGSYILHVGRSRHGFVVTTDRLEAVLPVPAQLKASVGLDNCKIGTEANCAAIMADKPFLRLEFDGEATKTPTGIRTVYEVTWTPVTDGKPDRTRARKTPGLEPQTRGDQLILAIPVWWFGGLKRSDTEIEVELRGIDGAGNRSTSATIRLAVGELLAAYGGDTIPLAKMDLPIDAHQATDLPRFIAAAATEGDRNALKLLTAVEPSPADEQSTIAFAEAVLSRDSTLTLRATVTGAVNIVTLTVPVEIRDRLVHVPLTAEQMTRLLQSLPIQNQSVKEINATVGQDRRAWIYITLGGSPESSRNYTWSPESDSPISADILDTLAVRNAVERDALYQAMLNRHGQPRQPEFSASSAGMWFYDPKQSWFTTLKYALDGGKLREIQFSGALSSFRVGELAKPLDAVAAQLKLDDSQARQTFIQGNVATNQTLKLDVTTPGKKQPIRFSGKLGNSLLRPD